MLIYDWKAPFLLQPYQDPPLDQQLANSLPQKDHFATFVSGILNFLSSQTPGAASAIVLRTLAITADYEHGQVMIKTILKKRPTTVPDFCFKLSSEFSKDNPVSIESQKLHLVEKERIIDPNFKSYFRIILIVSAL